MLTWLPRALIVTTMVIASAELSALGSTFSQSSKLLQEAVSSQSTRAQREEVERQIDSAPEQRGSSNPTNNYPTPWTAEETPPALDIKRLFLWDVGGWVRATFTTFDTTEDTDRTLRDYDARVWGKINYTDNQSVYARGRTFITDYNSGDAPGGGRNSNIQNIRVDQAFYEGRWARTLGWDPIWDFDVTLGRQFFFMGKGAALSNVLDGARIDVRYGEHGIMALAAQTIHYSPDFDSTLPEKENESDRQFFGFSAYTTAFLKRKFYMYALAEVDRNDHRTATQSWDYQAYYFGVGGHGDIPLPWFRPNSFSYSAEVMVQTGRSVATGTTTKEDIKAYGWLIDLYWLPGDLIPLPSKTSLSYYFGSGDGDRSAQLGTVGGNTAGTDDAALNYFGFVNTGFSLAPRLTNLHAVRLNAEVTPISNSEHKPWTREIKVGVSLYTFIKHHSGARITDFTSVGDSSYVGSELDLYVDWSVVSDFDVTFRYGFFKPGSAFQFHDDRNFFSLAATLSF